MPLITRRPADPTITIVVPARNEARNLELVLPALPDVHEVIVVDGHSVDDTEAVVAPDAARRPLRPADPPRARATPSPAASRPRPATSSSCSTPTAPPTPSEIAAFVVDAGAPAPTSPRAAGSSAQGGSEDITWLRDLGNRVLTGITNLLFRTRYTDLCYGYNAFWRDVLPVLAIPSSQRADRRSGATASRSRP